MSHSSSTNGLPLVGSYQRAGSAWTSHTYGFPMQRHAPQAAVCLNMIDMDNRDDNVRVRAHVHHRRKDEVEMEFGTWGNRLLYQCGMNFIISSSEDKDIAIGVVKGENIPEVASALKVEYKFPHRFSDSPNVFMGMSRIDVSGDWYATTWVGERTPEKAVVEFGKWGGAQVHSCEVQVIAVAREKHGVEIGQFDIEGGTGTYTYPLSRSHDKNPHVIVGITHINVGSKKNMRIDVSGTAKSRDKIEIVSKSWGGSESQVHRIKGYWLAISL
ncbi:unnamed protein product [Rhizoctonia solani]|uniref:H-type lectin domain-containing protein n=1 Tax=Rhizoctonia solani TaxID=456999 RepID=A0A8H3GUG7_9AGAM|nr:unnamed protein product [Rhizoctonia solani]